ncbi:hypothetical protein NE237_030472 [Protea cynaroides]|uniref:Uncharacterized protein n=1 Tax=Protea cynaroides TaxID=273540 RepID=A0A9Q0GUA6_9MAGN|nr:hypothetical protein NE237_030472 [Protea cynaroides]
MRIPSESFMWLVWIKTVEKCFPFNVEGATPIKKSVDDHSKGKDSVRPGDKVTPKSSTTVRLSSTPSGGGSLKGPEVVGVTGVKKIGGLSAPSKRKRTRLGDAEEGRIPIVVIFIFCYKEEEVEEVPKSIFVPKWNIRVTNLALKSTKVASQLLVRKWKHLHFMAKDLEMEQTNHKETELELQRLKDKLSATKKLVNAVIYKLKRDLARANV